MYFRVSAVSHGDLVRERIGASIVFCEGGWPGDSFGVESFLFSSIACSFGLFSVVFVSVVSSVYKLQPVRNFCEVLENAVNEKLQFITNRDVN